MKRAFFISIIVSSALFANDTFLHQFFNKKVCDQVLNNNGYFKTCYDYKAKGAKYVAYTLDGSLVNKLNIKERPRFYTDKNIPKRYRSEYSDYTKNRYSMDRGHLMPDAQSDYSQRSLKASYAMSNIIPQHFSINRSSKAWAGLERFGRSLAVKLGKINVLNGVIYSSLPKRIGHNQIAIPYAYWKMYYSDEHNYQRCFYFRNEKRSPNKSKISDYEVSCKELLR